MIEFWKQPANQNELDGLVHWLKSTRGGPKGAAFERVMKLVDYFGKHHIRNVVLGVSGGVDSAVCLYLLREAAKRIPLKIRACVFHFSQYDAVFDNRFIEDLKRDTIGDTNIEWIERDLTGVENQLWNSLNLIHTEDVQANTNYALRYYAFFAVAQSYRGVTIGTTNLDELGYAGWFGKNSDMVVDLQIIHNLHKFQVKELAEFLKVPQSIINRAPVGDLISGATDEQNFGCTYDELSWLTYYVRSHYLKEWEPNNFKTMYFNDFVTKKFSMVHALHKQNSHKYQGQTYNPIFL